MIFLLLVIAILAAGCIDSPRTKADDWAKRFPEEIVGTDADDNETEFWEFDEREELTAETQSRYGQVVLFYEGDDDTTAQIDIKAFATSNAAEMALLEAMRDWQLRGVRFERFEPDREDNIDMGDARCEVAQVPGGRLSYCYQTDTLITISITAEDPETEIAEESLNAIMATVGAISANR